MRSICSVPNCSAVLKGFGLCRLHLDKQRRHGDPLGGGTRKPNGQGYRTVTGRIVFTIAGGKKSEHVLVAERALGKPLPKGAEVHHVDENPSNNDPSNLVICPDAAYHKLLHQRQRAFDACGHYEWRKCTYCKKYDDPANDMYLTRKKAHHRECDRAHQRARHQAKAQARRALASI